ncbi:MAG: sugar ABC transporter ATP-binding protein [Hyphomicrobiales bacterium]|jgi:ABC-type sugar transport system ATPase subunit|nr:sugar ABC transporter ATP-binding protein [Hyphomicrobiales bacterium]
MGQKFETPVVEMSDIVKTFPGVKALDSVSFSVNYGQIHALLGKNGAGKSTLMHVLTGLYTPDSGIIKIRGKHYENLTTAKAKEAGISLVSQHAKFVPGLSIAENVYCGNLPISRFGFIDWKKIYNEASEKLNRFELDIDVKRKMEDTTVAERQMIEIARALFTDSSVIILDEPTAPLPKHDVTKLFNFIRRQREKGASFIYISHYLEEIFEVADHVTVMRNGIVAGSSNVENISQPELIRMISGVNVERYRRSGGIKGKPILSLKGLTRFRAYTDIELTFHSGEVVGLTGLEGSGPGELARGLFGIEPLGDGKVELAGKDYKAGSPIKAIKQGLAYLPRDRHGLGIIGIRSVKDNISLSILKRIEPFLGLINSKKENKIVSEYINILGIKTPNHDTPVENLSGGNQQKVVVAKLSATEPKMLILDEPTQGVDVQAKVELLRIVDDLSKRGVAIAVVSDELSELIDICDRIVVFYRGKIIRQFQKSVGNFTTADLLSAIEGEAGGISNEIF